MKYWFLIGSVIKSIYENLNIDSSDASFILF